MNNMVNMTRMKITMIFLFIILIACRKFRNETKSIELIADAGKQDSIFRNLVSLTNNSIPENIWNDSLAFLVLPVQASCPSCRKKTINSIVKHQNSLADRHFIVISADGGRKTINAFFREQDKELPTIQNRLFLDSTNQASKYDLYYDKPTMYYTVNRKAYKKVAAIPTTVQEDLHEFFFGSRNERE